MLPTDPATDPTALAARWREHAQVLRLYGAAGRARMLELMAAELERCMSGRADAVVDLTTAAALSGFTRGHLRRMYREGRLIPAVIEEGEPRFRVSELPRKPAPASGADDDRSFPATRVQIAREVVHTPTRSPSRAA